jgi:hypothetical protein
MFIPGLSFGQTKSSASKKAPGIQHVLLNAQRLQLLFETSILTKGLSDLTQSDLTIKDCLKNSKASFITSKYDKFENLYDNVKYRPVKQTECSFISDFTNDLGANGWYFSGLLYSKVFNTLQYNTKKRASTVLDAFVFNFLQSLYNNFEGALPSTISVHVLYLSKDFTEGEQNYNYNTESMILSTSLKNLKNLVDNKITDTQFLKSASIYLLADDNNSFKKVVL